MKKGQKQTFPQTLIWSLFRASICTQKKIVGPENTWWLKSSVNIKFLLFTIFFPVCLFCFKYSRKWENSFRLKLVKFSVKVGGKKTRHWCSALLTTNSFRSLQKHFHTPKIWRDHYSKIVSKQPMKKGQKPTFPKT